MAKLPVAPQDGEADREDRAVGRRLAAIVSSVLEALGQPSDYLRTTIRPVSGDRFRVNVVAGADAASARIAHSFFLTADEKGSITGSTPEIQKCY